MWAFLKIKQLIEQYQKSADAASAQRALRLATEVTCTIMSKRNSIVFSARQNFGCSSGLVLEEREAGKL